METHGCLCTEWECPLCDHVNHTEGDINGEDVECEDCQATIEVNQ